MSTKVPRLYPHRIMRGLNAVTIRHMARFHLRAGAIILAATLIALAVLLAACSDPADENVSPLGPTTTEPTSALETTTTSGQPVEVARWSGTAATDTENFTVAESWEIHWKIDLGTVGAGVGVEWRDPDGYDGGLIQPDTAEGSSLVREGGTFYLHVTPYGAESWEVWIVDVPS